MDKYVVSLLMALLLASSLAAQPGGAQPSTLELDADYGSFERGEWRLVNVRIRLDPGVVRADEARVAGSPDFADNEWLFSGNVRVEFGLATIEADEARLLFQDDRLVSGELLGNPATFEDRGPDRENPVRGSANRLSYDTADGTLRLLEGVTVREGRNEYTGCDLIYDFTREAVTSGSSEECGEPLHIRIQVQGDDAARPAPDE